MCVCRGVRRVVCMCGLRFSLRGLKFVFKRELKFSHNGA